mmetsp:Transcript_22029/g.65907  ORF Transcript_22029/g.65907 Transcript_22029/m.65907 type:complete len:224 (+) Transcript_22029:1073-1744(+)
MPESAHQSLCCHRHRFALGRPFAAQHLGLDVHGFVPIPRHLARKQLVEQDAKRKDVHPAAAGLGEESLRRHIVGSARRGLLASHQAKVAYLCGRVAAEQDIVRLDVAVHHRWGARVQVRQARGNLRRQPQAESAAEALPAAVHALKERAGAELHDDAAVGWGEARAKQLDDVDVRERRMHLHLLSQGDGGIPGAVVELLGSNFPPAPDPSVDCSHRTVGNGPR